MPLNIVAMNIKGVKITGNHSPQVYSFCNFRYFRRMRLTRKPSVTHDEVLELDLVVIFGILQDHSILNKLIENGIWYIVGNSVNVHPGTTVLLEFTPQSLKKQPSV